MASNPRVFELLEEMLNSGRTPEDVCAHCPELLPEVRRRWQTFRLIDEEVAALLPDSKTRRDPDGSRPLVNTGELPQIPDYRVDGVLGSGGMGVVYRAWDLRLDRLVALKMLLAGAQARPTELERFLREAQAVAALRHPNIVQVHDVGEVGGRPYFTMEFVEGGDLAETIQGNPQTASKAATIVAILADAIHVAHQCGIVHRDLKPSNVLLAADGTPKVTDFGLARRLEGGTELTLSGSPMGTPSYMAPEQARGDKHAVGPATDVYALGAILYELLTGRPPFRAETPTATLHQVITDDPVSPARLNPRVPRDLDTICLKCLHKGEFEQAVALTERAVAAQGGNPFYLFAQGLARYRQGRFDDAIKLMNGDAARVMGPSPRLVLAMAQWQKGQKDQARKTLAAAISSYDWSASKADNHDAWIAHILRREAQALIFPDRRAFLEGTIIQGATTSGSPWWRSASFTVAVPPRPAS